MDLWRRDFLGNFLKNLKKIKILLFVVRVLSVAGIFFNLTAILKLVDFFKCY